MDSCKLSFRQEIAAIYSAHDKSSPLFENWGLWFDRCSKKLDQDSKLRWSLVNTKNDKWIKAISQSEQSKTEIARLLTIENLRTERLNKIETLRSIIEKILNFKTTKSAAQDALQLQRFSRNLSGFPEGMLKNFGLLLLSKESNNKASLKRLMEEVIHWEARVIPFYGIDIPLSEETWSSVDQLLIDATESINDRVLLRAFGSRVFQFVEPTKLPKFSEKIDTKWSLNELRVLAASAWYAPLFPAFWYSQLSGRVASSEMGALIDSLLTRLPANKWNDHDLWVFSEWLPAKDEYRKGIIKAIANISQTSNPYLKELLVRLSENAVLRRELEKEKIISNKALFKLKRDYYSSLLQRGAQVDYALYQLTMLGDEDPDYLWWYALNPFRK